MHVCKKDLHSDMLSETWKSFAYIKFKPQQIAAIDNVFIHSKNFSKILQVTINLYWISQFLKILPRVKILWTYISQIFYSKNNAKKHQQIHLQQNTVSLKQLSSDNLTQLIFLALVTFGMSTTWCAGPFRQPFLSVCSYPRFFKHIVVVWVIKCIFY